MAVMLCIRGHCRHTPEKYVSFSHHCCLLPLIPPHSRMSTFLSTSSHTDNTTCGQSVKAEQNFTKAQPKSYTPTDGDEWEWECLPLKSSELWPNHTLSLLSFRRPALFIKACDGYLSQYVEYILKSFPPYFPPFPSQTSFFYPPMSTSPSSLHVLPFPSQSFYSPRP